MLKQNLAAEKMKKKNPWRQRTCISKTLVTEKMQEQNPKEAFMIKQKLLLNHKT